MERQDEEELTFGEIAGGSEAEGTDEDFRESVDGGDVSEQLEDQPNPLGDKIREGYDHLKDDLSD